ncbi:F-box protein [Quillaja saponaria]|uniref:F-box protein n=1 Tax=Quillaja saponaria TaxID=32244 RepID=A0AAD7KWH3_QUISA|nr:F-box protein [Quillaja saponaria]
MILGSCNGLLCLRYFGGKIVLWNMSIREYHWLPDTQMEFPGGFGSCEFANYGFGYDSVNEDYKVVRLVQFLNKKEKEFKVYSLKDDVWRRSQDFPYYLCYKYAWGVLVNGALHWAVTQTLESEEKFVLAFGISMEVYGMVPLPEFSDRCFHLTVHVLGGCLCLLCHYFGVRVDVWVMRQYEVKESWG